MDRTYLSLLPQPFTLKAASNTSKSFGGELFINAESTERIFKEKAGQHKIIHIGTHAESNNAYPEYSRLLFAGEKEDATNNNALYVG